MTTVNNDFYEVEECNQNDDDITPNISKEEVEIILEKFYGLKEGNIKKLVGYDDLNYQCSPRDNNNPFIKIMWPHGYILKITNSLDSKSNDFCEAQNRLMFFLRENNILSPLPVKSLFGQYFIKIKIPLKVSSSHFQKKHIVRLLEFQPGTTVKDVSKSYPIFYKLGKFIGNLNEVLKKFFHPVYKSHYSKWHLQNMPVVKRHLQVVKNPSQRQLVEDIADKFVQEVLSKANNFEKGIIHGDLNENNILMSQSENGEWEVNVILDFGDSHLSYYFFDLAISLSYAMLDCKRHNLDAVVGAGHLLAGYLAEQPKFILHHNLLKICICARLCQSLVLGLKSYSLNPENSYVLESQSMGWILVETFWNTPIEEIAQIWSSVIHSYNSKGELINAH